MSTDLDELIDELTTIDAQMRRLQDPATESETIRNAVDQYYDWYARALAVLPDELCDPFRDAYEGGNWTSRIRAFVSDPLAPNPMFDGTKPDNLLTSRRFQHSYDEHFRPNMEQQRQILIEALHRQTRNATAQPNEEGSVFLVHGHNEAVLHEIARFVDRAVDRDLVILREQPNRGKTIIEKFEDEAVACSFAIALLTADDLGRAKGVDTDRERARQNVVLEAGYFIGKLGRHRVVLLHENNVELPSDLSGILYLALSGDWKLQLARELEAAGLSVDYASIR